MTSGPDYGAVVATPSVFGELDASEPRTPAIEIGSKHHLDKMVNGVPLIRPAWYYNVGVQGDGLVDIQSHMTDQMQWLIGETLAQGPYFDFAKDVTALDAKRWGTPVSIELFEKSTGMSAFPEALEPRNTGCSRPSVQQRNSISIERRTCAPTCGMGTRRADWQRRHTAYAFVVREPKLFLNTVNTPGTRCSFISKRAVIATCRGPCEMLCLNGNSPFRDLL